MTLLDVEIATSAWNARAVREHLVKIGAALELEPEHLEELVTAVGEAFANAVEHAETDRPVRILVQLHTGDRLVAMVRDWGRGIGPLEIERALPPVAAERGRGIPLMRRCSRSMEITTPVDGGTLVALVWEGVPAPALRHAVNR